MRLIKYFSLLTTLLFSLLPIAAEATHVYGADFSYQSLGGLTYKLTIAIYADCGATSTGNLPGGTPEVKIYNDAVSTNNPQQTQTLTINAPSAGVNVTPVCPSQVNNTSCNGGIIPGVKRFIYTKTITLPAVSASWRFRFTGNTGGGTSTGRSSFIDNILNPGSSIMVLDATLNNIAGPNSSPQFTTIPTPFYCNNISQQYNQGAVDPDGDLLSYQLAPALENGGTVTYVGTYSATAPIATSVPISFDTSTGQLIFTPNNVQRSIVVNKVKEYRNGVLVGTTMREMTFIVLSTCNSAPPYGPTDTTAGSATGGVVASPTDFNVCYGVATQIHFNIKPTDPEGDTINVATNGLPAGATAVITGNNTTSPLVSFDWNTTGVLPGNYTFFVTYKDFGCPLSNQQTIAYTVHIVKPNELSSSPILAPTQCVHRAAIQYNTAFGITPRTIAVSSIGANGTPAHSITDFSGTAIDSLLPGTYTVTISSPYLDCISQYTITIADSGVYPFRPVTAPVFYCVNDNAVALTAIPAPSAVLHWYDPAGTPLPQAPVPSTATGGIFNYLVSQQYKVCESLQDTAKVYVTARPIASVAGPLTVCTYDTAVYAFNGNVGVGPIIAYNWTWDNPDYLNGSGPGPYYLNWQTTGIKTLTLQVFENQCPSFIDTVHVLVKPSPHAVLASPNEACQTDSFSVQYNIYGSAGEAYVWDFAGANVHSGTGRGPYEISYDTSGIKKLMLVVDLNGCYDTAIHPITIHPSPDVDLLNITPTVCMGDKIYLHPTGGAYYTWSLDDPISTDPDGEIFTRVVSPHTYTVYAHSQYGCVDSAKRTFTDVQPCCQFSYPDAFTPNGDNRNDQYHIITYGNETAWELSIFDRWGHRVFLSFDPKMGWDGTYGGKLCEEGVYFYYLKARCYTGHDEEKKGDFILMR